MQTKAKTSAASSAIATTRPPDESEKAAIEAALARIRDRSPRVTVKFSQDKRGKVDLHGTDHDDREGWLAQIIDAFGTRGTAFALAQLNHMLAACRDSSGSIDASRVNAMLAMIEAVRPNNELEAALAVQMAITHFATLSLMSRALQAEQIPQFNSTGSMAIKLARTFAQQLEALGKLQRGGEQIVKVVHVHPGAQAIVGNVTTAARSAHDATGPGGGVLHETDGQPHAKALPAARSTEKLPALWRQDEEREPVPIASGAG